MLLNLFNNEGEHPWEIKAVVRRLILWTLVCWACAWPSMRIAASLRFDVPAMVIGICLFPPLFVLVTASWRVGRLVAWRGMRNALLMGYYGLAIISLGLPQKYAMAVFIYPGIAGVWVAGHVVGENAHGNAEVMFALTLIAVCAEGVVLNLGLMAATLLIVYPIARAVSRKTQELRGFEVIIKGTGSSGES